MPGELPEKILVQVAFPEPPFGGVVVQEFPEEIIIELGSGPPILNIVLDKLAVGDINGVNKVFQTEHNFSLLWVYKNGVRQHKNEDYTITGANQFTFFTAPEAGDIITYDYAPTGFSGIFIGGGGATIAATTNLISGDGIGNGLDSGIASADVVQKQNFPTPENENDIVNCLRNAGLCLSILFCLVLPSLAAPSPTPCPNCFGSIPRVLELPAGQSVRRNAGNTAFEAFTPSGGGGTPGGSPTQVQYNNSGAFGGITGVTTDGTSFNATLPLKSSGNVNTPGSFTPNNSGIRQVDVNGIEMLRIWADGANNANLFIADRFPQNLNRSSATYNVFIGTNLTDNLVNGFNNVAIGDSAFYQATSASETVSIGVNSGDLTRTGRDNTFIGSHAAANEPTASDTTAIGFTATIDYGVTSNSTAIGANATVNADNTFVAGDPNITDLWAGQNGQANIHGNTLFLIPTPTPSPVEGRLYTDPNHHAYYYNGTIWKQLDNDTPTPTPTPTPSATFTPTPTATATSTPTPTPTATPTATVIAGFTAHFTNGGSAIALNSTTLTPWTCPYSGTITGYSISADTGTCTLKTWKKANGTAIPTVADNISTSGVSLSSGTHIRSSTVSDFTTTTVTAGDMFMATVTATSGPTDITFQVEITR